MGFYSCDDGNLLDGDGCNSLCQVEYGYVCYGGTRDRPDICWEICNDGYDYHMFDCDAPAFNANLGCTIHC